MMNDWATGMERLLTDPGISTEDLQRLERDILALGNVPAGQEGATMTEDKPQVWLYYWRHMSRYAQAFDDLLAAMTEAESMTINEEGSIESIVDTDGTEYDGFKAMQAWMDAYRETHPAPAPEEHEQAPAIVREFRGQRWLVTEG